MHCMYVDNIIVLNMFNDVSCILQKLYHLVISHSHGKSPFLIGKPSINGPFSMAMLVITRGY